MFKPLPWSRFPLTEDPTEGKGGVPLAQLESTLKPYAKPFKRQSVSNDTNAQPAWAGRGRPAMLIQWHCILGAWDPAKILERHDSKSCTANSLPPPTLQEPYSMRATELNSQTSELDYWM